MLTHWLPMLRHTTQLPQAVTKAATKRQRAALTLHDLVTYLLFKRRDVLLAMTEADRGRSPV